MLKANCGSICQKPGKLLLFIKNNTSLRALLCGTLNSGVTMSEVILSSKIWCIWLVEKLVIRAFTFHRIT